MVIAIIQIPLNTTVSILNVCSYSNLLFDIENLYTLYTRYILNKFFFHYFDQLEIIKTFPDTISFNVLLSFLNSNS